MAPLTVADVIDNARDLHPALSKENVPDRLMIRELTRAVSDLYDQIYPRVPAFLAIPLEIDLTDPAFNWVGVMNDVPSEAPGLDLTTRIPGGWKDITQGEFWIGSGATARCWWKGGFTPWEQRNVTRRAPSFTLRNNALYFLGGQLQYSRFSMFRLMYTANPADSVKAGTVPLPHDAREPLASRLAVFGLLRLVGDPKFKISSADVNPFAQRASGERKEFLTAVFRITQRQGYVMRNVQPDPGGPWGPNPW